jgi:hypothetical protein
MNVIQFKELLNSHPEKRVVFALPGGRRIPEHCHVTEVGHVMRKFVDCGGTRRSAESCLLQTWVADDKDHRLHGGKLADIFAHAADVLPQEDLPVEIEYEDGVISQFPVLAAGAEHGVLVFQPGLKHTDCLAKELCLPAGCCPGGESSCCN